MPAIRHRLDWRLDNALIYLRTLLDPIGSIPTAQAGTIKLPTSTETPLEILPPLTPFAESSTPAPITSPVPPTITPTIPISTPLPGQVVLPAPLFEGEDWNNCGPATLAINMRYYGWQGDQYTIATQVKPDREDRNVSPNELIAYVQQNVGGLRVLARVDGDLDLLRSIIASGFPVIVEESMHITTPFWINDDLWAGHYLLLTGYDDSSQLFIVQDTYLGANVRLSYADLERNWQAFNRFYMLVYPLENEDAVHHLLGDSSNIDVNYQQALLNAQTETQSQPGNLYTWFNLGTNLVYFERYAEAAQAFDMARSLGLPQRMVRYQFAPFEAYYFSGRIDDLMAVTGYALQVTPNSEEALLWQGWAYYAQGNMDEARTYFQRSLAARPGYQDAMDALAKVK